MRRCDCHGDGTSGAVARTGYTDVGCLPVAFGARCAWYRGDRAELADTVAEDAPTSARAERVVLAPPPPKRVVGNRPVAFPTRRAANVCTPTDPDFNPFECHDNGPGDTYEGRPRGEPARDDQLSAIGELTQADWQAMTPAQRGAYIRANVADQRERERLLVDTARATFNDILGYLRREQSLRLYDRETNRLLLVRRLQEEGLTEREAIAAAARGQDARRAEEQSKSAASGTAKAALGLGGGLLLLKLLGLF